MTVVAKRATYPQLYARDNIVTFEHGFNFLPTSVELAQRFGELQGAFYGDTRCGGALGSDAKVSHVPTQ